MTMDDYLQSKMSPMNPNPMDMMMSMTFHGGFKTTILFSWWKTSSAGTFALSWIAVFAFAIAYEGLKSLRTKLETKKYTNENSTVINMMMNRMHFLQSFLHLLQVTLGYLLMLITMTFNTWLFLAVVLGLSFGYFLTNWYSKCPSNSIASTDSCH